MFEYGAPYSITASDGTSVTFNDGGGLVLEDVTGFDSPNVRQNVAELPETDGATAGNFFFGARPVTLTGRIINATPAARNVLIVQLQRALRGLRSDVTIRSSPSGLPAMQASGRLDNIRVTGGFLKQFQISLICADPRIYSQALNSSQATGQVASSGAAFPLVFPINFGGGTGATVSVSLSNAGNFDSPPLLRVTGPVTNPAVRNATTDMWLYLDNVDLAAGEYVDIDMANRSVTRTDGTSLYHKVRIPTSDWWLLPAGANSVELWATTPAASATVRVLWRDVWA